MNEHVRSSRLPPGPGTTQAADGFARRRWSVAEIAKMIEAGIVSCDEPFELIGGEIVAKVQKGARHEIIRNELMLFWADRRPPEIKFAIEAPLRIGPYDEPEPDLILFPAWLGVNDVRGENVLLVVEISESRLSYDLKIKAPRYAGFGVCEYWVIDASTLRTTVHRQPSSTGYAAVTEQPVDELLVPSLCPALAVRLADLDLGSLTA